MKNFFYICIFFLIAMNAHVYAQKQNNRWYVYSGADIQDSAVLIDFNSGKPLVFRLPISDATKGSLEGKVCVSDSATGDLLFFSNGVWCYDRTGAVMPNGSGLLGSHLGMFTSTNAVVAIPEIGRSGRYYLLTNDEEKGPNGLRYSMVDMNLRGGLGDIDRSIKNRLIRNNTSESIAVAPSENEDFYWILCEDVDSSNNKYYAYGLSECGIDTSSFVTSEVGPNHTSLSYYGRMEFSPDYRKLAVARPDISKPFSTILLFDFDRKTGKLSNPISLNMPTGYNFAYGIEFSPNGKLLYATCEFGGIVVQFNLAAGTPAQINASRYQFPALSGQDNDLQLGPDGIIYIARINQVYIAQISNPNGIGAAAGFIEETDPADGIDVNLFCPLTGASFSQPLFYLKNYNTEPPAYLSRVTRLDSCLHDSIRFILEDTTGVKTTLWTFGDKRGITMSGNKAQYKYADTGRFEVRAIVTYINCKTDTLKFNHRIKICKKDTTTNQPVDTFCSVFIPKAFSPNGDHLNDRFSINFQCQIENFQLQIYTRWGEKVYESVNQYQNWDGSYHGNTLPDGTYIYRLEYKKAGLNSIPNVTTGMLVLLK